MTIRLRLTPRTTRRRAKRRGSPKVYVIRMGDTPYYKIGYTTSSVARRMAQLQTGNPFKLEIVKVFQGTTKDEAALHAKFANKRAPANNEWFILSTLDLLRIR